jgi:hypothetical protein
MLGTSLDNNFFEVITEGLHLGGEVEFDFEEYVKRLFDRTRDAVRRVPDLDRGAFEAEMADFSRALQEVKGIGEKRLRSSALSAIAAALV